MPPSWNSPHSQARWPPSMTLPVKNLIVFATRWGAQFGGINSFNADLLAAFAAACYEQVNTVCVVLNATDEEVNEVLNVHQVRLISLGLPDETPFKAPLEPLVWDALCRHGIALDPDELVWLGHDRITAEIALTVTKKRGGRSALIHHMSYALYEAFAENSAVAHAKEQEQKKLFEQADILLAVGPLLRDALRDLVGRDDVTMLVPGLVEGIVDKPAPRFYKGFFSGRLNDGSRHIKQAHLGVAAFGAAIRKATTENNLQSAFHSSKQPRLTLRGVDFQAQAGQVSEETELKRFAEEYAGRPYALHALPFTADRNDLFNELSASSVAMMPSWHEGFGLVAWEAIAAGVPLILSNKSGAYQLLQEFEEGYHVGNVTAIDVAGSHTVPYFQDADVETLSQALMTVAATPGARTRAFKLRENLYKHYRWPDCAKSLAEVLGWETNEARQLAVKASTPVAAPVASEATGLLTLPQSTWHPGADLSDSQLLRAEEASVPFDSHREAFLATQLAWAQDNEFSICVRLLVGAGGVGKTRLALELGRRLQAEGWRSGFLSGDCSIANAALVATEIKNAGQPSYVVIDYAETRQPIVLALLKALLPYKKQLEHPVRLLLLARDGGEWWAALPAKDAACESLLDGDESSGPFPLPALYDSSNRQQAYQQALSTFAQRLCVEAPAHQPVLFEEHFSSPLFIQMAALMTLRGERPGSALALPRALVNHERRYWGRVLTAPGENSDQQVRQSALLMTLATLVGVVFPDRVVEDLWVALGEDRTQLRRLFQALAPLYSERERLHGLRPDLIGEALVAQSLLGTGGAQLLDVVLGKTNSQQRRSALTVLARLLRNRMELAPMLEQALVQHFRSCVEELVEVCIDTPGPLPEIVEAAFKQLPKAQQSQAAGMLRLCLRVDVPSLASLRVVVFQSLVDKAKERLNKPGLESKAQYAEAMGGLALAFHYQGLTNQALETINPALDIYKQQLVPGAVRSEQRYAKLLNNYAILQSDAGHSEEALDAAERALTIVETMAKRKPNAHDSALALALSTYSSHLSESGRTEKALIIGRRSLDIRSRLAKKHPQAYESDLATSLDNHANDLSADGQLEEAWQMAKQALDIRLRLAAEAPERYRSDIGLSYHNNSDLLARMGRAAEAMSACERALAIRQKLAETKPERFEPEHANSLISYAVRLSEKGRLQEAQKTCLAALEIYRRLALATPERFESRYADALNNYSLQLTETGQFDEALEVITQALGVYTQLVELRPERYVVFHCRVQLSFLYIQWLAMKQVPTPEQIDEILQVLQSRPDKPVEFSTHCFWAFTQVTSASVEHALLAWDRLHFGRRYAAQGSYLTLCALADHCIAPETAPAGWHAQLKTYRDNRQGQLPAWMLETARRAGCDLQALLDQS